MIIYVTKSDTTNGEARHSSPTKLWRMMGAFSMLASDKIVHVL